MNKTRIILLLCLGLLGCADIKQFNRGAEATYQAVHIVDMVQTVHGPASDSCYAEVDPISRAVVGPHPSQATDIAWGFSESLIHYGVHRFLAGHEWNVADTVWQALTIGAASQAVVRNYQIGIRIGAPNTDQGYQARCVHR